MLLSTREIAQRLGTDRNTVYRLIHKLDIKPDPNNDSKTLKYSPDAVKLIRDAYKDLQRSKGKTTTQEQETPQDAPSDLVDAYKQTISMQQATIENLQKQIDVLTALLNHEQELRARQLAIESGRRPTLGERFKGLFRHKTPETPTDREQ